jgi:hypothetical protein
MQPPAKGLDFVGVGFVCKALNGLVQFGQLHGLALLPVDIGGRFKPILVSLHTRPGRRSHNSFFSI